MLNCLLRFKSDSEAIRTLDPRLRRALLYPAELRNQPLLQVCGCKGSLFIGFYQYFFVQKHFPQGIRIALKIIM